MSGPGNKAHDPPITQSRIQCRYLVDIRWLYYLRFKLFCVAKEKNIGHRRSVRERKHSLVVLYVWNKLGGNAAHYPSIADGKQSHLLSVAWCGAASCTSHVKPQLPHVEDIRSVGFIKPNNSPLDACVRC
jgi:hypothetical protein